MSQRQAPRAVVWVGLLVGLIGIGIFAATILGAFGRPQAQPGEATSLKVRK